MSADRRRWRWSGRALVATALAVVAGPLTTGQPGAAQDGPVDLTLLDQDFVVSAGGPWQARFALDGIVAGVPVTTTAPASTIPGVTIDPATVPTTAPPAATATVRVVLYRPVEDRFELAEVVSGERRDAIDNLGLDLASVIGADGTLTLTVPTTTAPNAADALTLRQPALYPIAVEVVVDDEVVAEHHTFLERLPLEPATTPPMNLALVAAIPEPAVTDRDRVEEQEQLTAVAELAAAVDGPLTASIPPALLEGLDDALTARLREALVGDEVLALPTPPLDPSSAVAIGEGETFTRRLRAGEDAIGTALPGVDASRSGWLATEPVSTDAAVLLRDLGTDLFVFDEDGYADLDGNIGGFVDSTLAIDVDLGEAGTMAGIVTSPTGALLLADDDVEPAAAAVQILAELVTTRRELGPEARRSVVLATPGLSVPDPAVAGALAALTADAPDLRLAPLSALASATDTMQVEGEPQTVTLPAVAGPDLTERAERVELTSVSAESAASMRVDDDAIEQWRADLDRVLSTGLSDAQVDAVLARISSEADAVRSAVVAPQPFELTLTGRSSTLRVNLRNTSDETLRVIVRASSPKLTFPEGDQDVELAPEGVTEVLIPVEARSNGTSAIEIDLVTPTFGQRIAGPVVLTARVNALTGLGQVITGGAVLVLGSWWFGHFRRRRRQRLAQLETSPSMLDTVSPDAAVSADDDALDIELVDLDERPT